MLEKELIRSIENPDSQLAADAQGGDTAAEEKLIRKYTALVLRKARAYFMVGAEESDVIQEGMIGLMKAVRCFETDKGASFATFAERCITNQIISAMRSAARSKHSPLNTSVSLNQPAESDETGKITIADTIRADISESPEEMLILKDVTYYILHNGDKVFSDMEMQVLVEAMKGYTSEQVARRTGKSRKSVDNALQRAKKKIYDYLRE